MNKEPYLNPEPSSRLPLVNLNPVLPGVPPHLSTHRGAPRMLRHLPLSDPMLVYKLLGPDVRKMWLVPLTGLGTNSEPGSEAKGAPLSPCTV